MSDLAARNREHFNKHAVDTRGDWLPMIRAIIAELQSRRAWISPALDTTTAGDKSSIKLLDYACGNGTVSKALIPYVGEVIGLDVSEGMVAEYHKSATELGEEARMHAYVYDLLGQSETPSPVDLSSSADFDLVVISMALHHVSEPAVLLERFATLLKPGGACVVLDMVTAPQESDVEKEFNNVKVKHTVGKHGFSDEELAELYAQAGLVKFEYIAFDEPFEATMHGKKMKIPAFIARGEKKLA